MKKKKKVSKPWVKQTENNHLEKQFQDPCEIQPTLLCGQAIDGSSKIMNQGYTVTDVLVEKEDSKQNPFV